MNQKFIIGPLTLIQDEEGYGVAHLRKTKQENGEGIWEVIATFKYGPDAVIFFTNYLVELTSREQANLSSKNKNEN